ncbi:MAG TPA: hypothetical protein VIH26_07980 [Anaerolineales bacterium]
MSYAGALPIFLVAALVTVCCWRRANASGAEQPCLLVNDVRLGDSSGQIALWIGGGAEAFFSTKLALEHFPAAS